MVDVILEVVVVVHLEIMVDLEVALDGQLVQEVLQPQVKEAMVVIQLAQVLVFTLQQVAVVPEL